MKYIATRNFIYDISDWVDDGNCYHKWFDEDDKRLLFKDDIVKESDKLEDLLDGFYLDLGGEFDDTYLRKKDKFEFLKELAFDYMRKDKEATLYGFIKTSKGLIYVAKMNDKGDLELI